MAEDLADNDVDDLLSQLTQILVDLEKNPDSVQLLRRQIRLMDQLGMTAEVLDAYGRLSSLIMLNDESWLAYINTTIDNARQLSLDSFVDVLEKFDQAEKDYLSLPILVRHAEFVISSHQAARSTLTVGGEEPTLTVSEEVAEFLTSDTVRSMLQAVSQRSQGLLSESQAVWQPWLDWEVSIEATSSAYSTFCSEHCPQEYEQRLVRATQAAQGAKTKLSLEKRYGKTREDFESQIVGRASLDVMLMNQAYSSDLPSRAQVLTEYSQWEADQRLKPGGTGRAPTADHDLTRAVYERTVAQYARITAGTETTLIATNESIRKAKKDSKGKGKQKPREEIAEVDGLMDQRRALEEAIRAYKDAEATIWEDALGVLESSALRSRAIRACPHNGDAWCRQLLDLALTTTFERALALGLLEFPIGRSIDLVELFVCRAAYESRVELVEAVQANKPGDTTFKLEKFLLEWSETKAPEFLDQALMILDKPSKASRRGSLDQARDLFVKSIQRHDLDWPEAVYEAFVQFENVHGELGTVLEAKQHIEREQEKVAKRREKAAFEAQSYQQYVALAPPVDALAEQPMIVDGPEPTSQPAPSAAPAIEEEDTRLKRQAEAIPLVLAKDHRKFEGSEISISMLWRSTLFVTNFPREMDDEGIRNLFGQTRWPSRKYADSRRFCYITMESPAVAQEATVLHGYKTDDGFGLTVLISDPSVKTKRSDATNSTLFVGGLNPKTTEADVRGIFQERNVNAGDSHLWKWQQSKPDEAADKRSRSVRLSNLPDNAQEGLLQQALEKFVPVKRLEMFARSREAVAELESQAPFVFEGQEITIAEKDRRAPPAPPAPAASAAAVTESSTMFAPRTARKGKVIAKPRPTAAVAALKPNQTQAGQDDFRALVAAKNKQREDKLTGAKGDNVGEKRKSEHEEEQDAKRARQ
ncbi:hypothetical protein IAR55_003022 [Kwoniella newhampshirensis]|uniref:RRM domain-containing protein n=1 Tax=Kwoniella newhampshirensis TaxID=1651941 RepID=A0AAW0Z0K4_9TREE